MKVRELSLEEFTAFSSATLSFVTGINVFLGENGTGKSQVMKVLYALLRAGAELFHRGPQPTTVQSEEVRRQFEGMFKPDKGRLSSLLRRQREHGALTQLRMATDQGDVDLYLTGEPASAQVGAWAWAAAPEALFFPTFDLLAAYTGFTQTYDQFQTSFDRTFYDFCKALGRLELSQSATRGWTPARRQDLLRQVQRLLGGSVHREQEQFFVELGGQRYEAPLVAEGLRKIASLEQLIKTGAIHGESILLWDEPETNLNPQITVHLAGLLHEMAKAGVQIFLTTHDYFLSRKLSLLEGVEIRFFSFLRDSESGAVRIESSLDLADLPNPIIDQFERLYEESLDRFNDRMAASGEGEA